MLEMPCTLFPSANRREREGLSVGTEPVPSGANEDRVPIIRARHLVKIAHRSVNLIGAHRNLGGGRGPSEFGGIRQSWPHAQPFIYPIKLTPSAI